MQGSDKDLSGRSKDASVRRSRSNSAVSIQAAARGRAGRELRKEALSEHRSSVKAGLGDVVIDRGARAPSTAGEGGPPACLQAGGHPNTFKRDPTQRDILIKEGTSHEQSIYEQLQEESLVDFTPRYYGAMEHGALTLLRIGDETAWCAAPCVMDIKLGTRTFVESEVDNPKLRSDLADKIRYIDPAALTPEEAELGVTKLRYMQFRDATSSSASLGFRVEGIRVGADCFAECKRLRTPQQLCEALRWYVGGREALRAELQQQLHALRAALEKSEWLARHELVGSSLLFVYDAAHVAPDDPGHMPPRVRMIDFAKVVPLEPGCRLTHRAEWMQGNHEDGFLAGLDALIELWGDPLRALCSEPPPGAPDAPAPRLAPAPSEV